MAETKWLDSKVNVSYRDIFNIVENNELLKSFLNPDKLIEVSFSVATSLFTEHNGKTPYDGNVIHYLHGDATNPTVKGKKIIAHICNNIGGWGQGFVLAISKKWKRPEGDYRRWIKMTDEDVIGETLFVAAETDIEIANMVAQEGILPQYNQETHEYEPPIRYNALRSCLQDLAARAKATNASVHMPKIGSGLAGGDWNIIENIINEELINENVETYVYLWDENGN